MPAVNATSNCGIYEIEGIREFSDDPVEQRNFFLSVNEHLSTYQGQHRDNWKWPGILLFSDAKASRSNSLTRGEKLSDYIMANNLGAMTWSAWKRNPNTGNKIKIWMWSPNARRCDALINRLNRS